MQQASSSASSTPACISETGSGYIMPWGMDTGGSGINPASTSSGVGGFWTITVPCKAVIGRISFRVATASGTSCIGGTCGLQWVLMSEDRTAVLASVNLVSGGSPDINVAGVKTATFAAPVTLDPGTYVLGMVTDSTAIRMNGFAYDWSLYQIMNAGVARFGISSTAFSGNGANVSITPGFTFVGRNDGLANPPFVILGR